MTPVLLIMLYAACTAGTLYLLWIFYLAVMNLKRARNAGKLSRPALVLGTPILCIGYLLDDYDPSGRHI